MLKSSELYNFLVNSASAAALKTLIEQSVMEFKRGKKVKGTSSPVLLKNEGCSFIITRNEIIKLCEWYNKSEIDEVELEYLANSLELSAEFQYDEHVSNELFLLSSPEINGSINKSMINKIIKRLDGTGNL